MYLVIVVRNELLFYVMTATHQECSFWIVCDVHFKIENEMPFRTLALWRTFGGRKCVVSLNGIL